MIAAPEVERVVPGARFDASPWTGRAWSAVGRALALLVVVFPLFVRAAEVIPPPPPDHFNDYARLVSPATARALDQQLTQFERDTSNQLVVAIYPKMQSDSSVEDYTVRVAQAWRVGHQDRKNGAVLFFFMAEHQIYIQVGYGLEGALPDALCKHIVEDEIVPRFKAGQFDAGVRAGVAALQAAVRGEYKGDGRALADRQDGSRGLSGGALFGIFLILVFFSVFARQGSRRQVLYGSRGRRTIWWGGPGPWSGGGGGGWSGGGGGSFSGGGGSFGGGGAGGRW